jgi:pimeloyl-ACP methyl ester carboxylesterase
VTAALPTLKMPALVIWGKQDNFISAQHAEVLQRLLPKVQVMLIEQCGHLPQIEYSGKFNEAALGFLAEVDRSEVGAPAVSRMASAVSDQ